MAYRQTPGRGPTAAFKNVTKLLGPTVTEGGEVDPKTGVKKAKLQSVDTDRPSTISEKPPTWTDNYNSTTYVTESGKGIKRYSPKSNVVGGKVKYYDISKKNPMSSMTEIDQATFVDYLSKGDKATNQKYKKMTEEDIVTGGDTETLAELKS